MSEQNKSRREFVTATGAATAATMLAALDGKNSVYAEEAGLNEMGPTVEQLKKFMDLPSGPVVMVNLLKFKENGEEEYRKYATKVNEILKSLDAEIIFSGSCKATLIGGAEWDAVALVRYPDKMTLLEMSRSAEYQAIHHHREAGLKGQVNLAVFENW